ncbi:MAG: transposase [Planctomycetes bacterium]|nr:transposase [Planctomycetota bacterium]
MPRLPRIEFPGANYHVVTRGDGRRGLFHDPGHYERFTKGLEEQVQRCDWIVLAYCWMPNHIHTLIQTPLPNLATGMQHWLSGYANWYAKRNRRTGHLYQGRYKAFLVEDAGYYWALSRYIHLNPCCGSRPLASDPEAWPYSSFGGYARKGKQVPWIAYDQLHTYWRASVGGKDPARAYRGYVKAGLAERHNPFQDELRECVFGSEDFLRRMVALAEGDDPHRHQSTSRRLRTVSVKEILSVTSMEHGVEPLDYAGFRSSAAGRDMAAWLCRRWTGVTLAELGPAFGLDGTDSVSNLVRRAEKRSKESATWQQTARKIETALGLNTEHKA